MQDGLRCRMDRDAGWSAMQREDARSIANASWLPRMSHPYWLVKPTLLPGEPWEEVAVVDIQLARHGLEVCAPTMVESSYLGN